MLLQECLKTCHCSANLTAFIWHLTNPGSLYFCMSGWLGITHFLMIIIRLVLQRLSHFVIKLIILLLLHYMILRNITIILLYFLTSGIIILDCKNWSLSLNAGTENPADEEDRQSVAVEPETGGSYVVCFTDLKPVSKSLKCKVVWYGTSCCNCNEMMLCSVLWHVFQSPRFLGNEDGEGERRILDLLNYIDYLHILLLSL